MDSRQRLTRRSSLTKEGLRRPGVRFKRGRTPRRGPPLPLLVVALALILGLIILIQFGRMARRTRGAEESSSAAPPTPAAPPPTLASQLEEVWISLGARVEEPSGVGSETRSGALAPVKLHVYLPAGTTLLMANHAVTEAVHRAGGRVVEARESRAPPGRAGMPRSRLTMRLSAPGEGEYLLVLEPDPRRPGARIPSRRPRLALIIDDLGYSLNTTTRGLLELPWPLAMAILPGTPSARRVARAAHEDGHEVILHLPLEPHDYPRQDPGPFAILVSFPPPRIRRSLDEALAEVPHAQGVNNHMGSRATEEEPLMTVLLTEIRARGLYFVDSKTSPRSVACEIAPRLGLSCLANDLFIDDDTEEEETIGERLEELARIARRHGRALGIGHPRPSTLGALREVLPRLERGGIEIVPLRSLLGPEGPS